MVTTTPLHHDTTALHHNHNHNYNRNHNHNATTQPRAIRHGSLLTELKVAFKLRPLRGQGAGPAGGTGPGPGYGEAVDGVAPGRSTEASAASISGLLTDRLLQVLHRLPSSAR